MLYVESHSYGNDGIMIRTLPIRRAHKGSHLISDKDLGSHQWEMAMCYTGYQMKGCHKSFQWVLVLASVSTHMESYICAYMNNKKYRGT